MTGVSRRGFLKAIPFAAASMTLIKSDDKPNEVVFKLPDNMTHFNGGSHLYRKKDGQGEIFLPAGTWKMTEVRFIEVGDEQ